MRSVSLLLIAVSTLIVLGCKNQTPKERPFLMGFSASPHERTPAGKAQAQQFLSRNSDLVLEDFSEGVPWEEALQDQPFPQSVAVSLRIRKKMLEGKSLVLHVSPFDLKRMHLAHYWPITANESLKKNWNEKTFQDRDLQVAYTKFCLELIRQFQPMYFAYAVDVNYFAAARSDQWIGFRDFARQVYAGLKSEHPQLPIYVTLNASSFWKQQEVQEQRIREILPYSDFIAVSAYPHLGGFQNLDKLPKDFFSRLAKIGAPKPFAVADTGYPHPLTENGGTESDSQSRYLEFVLKESHKLQARFVVWFHYRNFQKMIDAVPAESRAPEVVKLLESRKNYGLVDDAGKSKNSHAVWKSWFRLPPAQVKSDRSASASTSPKAIPIPASGCPNALTAAPRAIAISLKVPSR